MIINTGKAISLSLQELQTKKKDHNRRVWIKTLVTSRLHGSGNIRDIRRCRPPGAADQTRCGTPPKKVKSSVIRHSHWIVYLNILRRSSGEKLAHEKEAEKSNPEQSTGGEAWTAVWWLVLCLDDQVPWAKEMSERQWINFVVIFNLIDPGCVLYQSSAAYTWESKVMMRYK